MTRAHPDYARGMVRAHRAHGTDLLRRVRTRILPGLRRAYMAEARACFASAAAWHLSGTLPLCPDCYGAIGGACGGPDVPYRPALPGEACGAADHDDGEPDFYDVLNAEDARRVDGPAWRGPTT